MAPEFTTQHIRSTFLPRQFVLEFRGDPLSLETRLLRGIRKLHQLGYEVEQTIQGDDVTVIKAKRRRPPRRAFSRLGGKA